MTHYYNLGTTRVYNFRNWRSITTEFVKFIIKKAPDFTWSLHQNQPNTYERASLILFIRI